MARTRKARTYNLSSNVRSALRRAWYYSPHRKAAVSAARVSYGRYECAECQSHVKPREYAIDHIQPAGSFSPDLKDLGNFAHRLFFGPLQLLCNPCHKVKTAAERKARKATK
jgi:hypothetical protein